MLIVEKYQYAQLSRKNTVNGRQYLAPDGSSLPSVTTILDKTKTAEKKKALTEWRKRVGEQNAATITAEAAGRGTTMHKFLEKYIMGENITPGSNLVQQQAFKMAEIVIEQMIKPNVNEVWGSEINLYFPQLYAGTTDLAGVWNNKPAIMDFKQTNKPKKREWIEDYFFQLVAYSQAHDELYGTSIDQGIVMMCAQDLTPQLFVLDGIEFQNYKDKWWHRLEKFYVENL